MPQDIPRATLQPQWIQDSGRYHRKYFNIGWPISSLLSLGIAVFLTFAARSKFFTNQNIADAFQAHPFQITPSYPIQHFIWNAIYLYQFLWITYVIFLRCQYEMDEIVFGKWLYITFNLANACTIGHTYLWIHDFILWSTIPLIAGAILLITASVIVHQYMSRMTKCHDQSVSKSTKNSKTKQKFENVANNDANLSYITPQWWGRRQNDRILLYVFAVNGISFYAAYCMIELMFVIGIAIHYHFPNNNPLSDGVANVIMFAFTGIVIGYWTLDFRRYRLYLKYTYSPYIVLMIGFIGILIKNELDFNELSAHPTSVMVLILLVLMYCTLVFKLVALRWCTFYKTEEIIKTDFDFNPDASALVKRQRCHSLPSDLAVWKKAVKEEYEDQNAVNIDWDYYSSSTTPSESVLSMREFPDQSQAN